MKDEEKEDKRIYILSKEKPVKAVIKLGVPLIAGMFIMVLYNLVDTYFIGLMRDDFQLAAVNLAYPVMMVMIAMSNMIGAGASSLIARSLGAEDTDKAAHTLTAGFLLTVINSAIVTAAGLLLLPQIVTGLGADDTTFDYTTQYVFVLFLGSIFTMGSYTAGQLLRAEGSVKQSIVGMIVGTITNIVLDPIFIYLMHMGVRGAALATVLSQGLSAAFVLRFLGGRQAELRLRLMTPADFLGHLDTAADIVSLGLSSFVMSATNFLVSAACNNMLSGYGGDLYVSIMTVVSSVRQMLDTPVLAIGDGTSPVLSFNYGARRPDNVRRSILIMTILGVSYTLVSWLLLLWKPGLFIGIFTPDKELIRDAVPALHLYFFAFPFQALQISGQTTFKALNKKKRAIFFSIFRKVIIVVPLTILLPGMFGMGVNGVFMAEPISNFVGGSASFTTMLLTILPELKRMEQDPLKAPAGDLS